VVRRARGGKWYTPKFHGPARLGSFDTTDCKPSLSFRAAFFLIQDSMTPQKFEKVIDTTAPEDPKTMALGDGTAAANVSEGAPHPTIKHIAITAARSSNPIIQPIPTLHRTLHHRLLATSSSRHRPSPTALHHQPYPPLQTITTPFTTNNRPLAPLTSFAPPTRDPFHFGPSATPRHRHPPFLPHHCNLYWQWRIKATGHWANLNLLLKDGKWQ
jgi:hypothetical protein